MALHQCEKSVPVLVACEDQHGIGLPAPWHVMRGTAQNYSVCALLDDQMISRVDGCQSHGARQHVTTGIVRVVVRALAR